MKYNIDIIKNMYDQNQKLKYIFFWGHTSKNEEISKTCFSQWYNCKFEVDNMIYKTAEQYMMAQKALLFKDNEIYKNIMNSNHPSEYKRLGRKIKNFNETIWNENKYNIVLKGNIAKFSQNISLKNFLINTNKRIIVEASPIDKIWGIGLSQDTKNIENPHNWQGENLLGFALMETRDYLNQ